MSYLQEATDIETKFANEWALGPNTPVENDNTDPSSDISRDPVTGAIRTYVTLTIVSTTSFQADLGKPSNTYRHQGTIIVQIHAPTDEGSGVARSLADAASGIFRSKFVGSGIVCKSPAFDRVGRNGAFYQINILIPFHRDTIF